MREELAKNGVLLIPIIVKDIRQLKKHFFIFWARWAKLAYDQVPPALRSAIAAQAALLRSGRVTPCPLLNRLRQGCLPRWAG